MRNDLTEFRAPGILLIRESPSLVLIRIFHLAWLELTPQAAVSQGRELSADVGSIRGCSKIG